MAMTRGQQRRARRRAKREKRSGRRLKNIVLRVGVPGDTADTLRVKVHAVLDSEESDTPFLDFLLLLFEKLLPILLNLLKGL